MKCLVVSAHPLSESLTGHFSAQIINFLESSGHEVVTVDLYQQNFHSVLTAEERRSYYENQYETTDIAAEVQQLLDAEGIVLVFPTWWFGFPAILKGWFDRVWGPGIAYNHAPDLGRIIPQLTNLKKMIVVTTLGAPWWIDVLVMRRPVKRIIKIALLKTCAPQCQLEMFALYKCEDIDRGKVTRFLDRVLGALVKWSRK